MDDLPPSSLDTSYVDAFLNNEKRIKHNNEMARKQWDSSRQEAMNKWFANESATGPNIFYPRWPNWCSGYDETPFEFTTKDELEQCPHIQNFLKNGYDLQFSKSTENWLGVEFWRYNLMAVQSDKFWMIGSFKRSKMLDGWYPEWKK